MHPHIHLPQVPLPVTIAPSKHYDKSNRDSLHSTSSSSTESDLKAFDLEAGIGPALIAGDPDARPGHFRNVYEELIFVFTVMMATASTTFVQGVININTSTIGTDFHMTPQEITWIVAAIGLSSGSFMLFFGKTADLFGQKFQIVTGLAFLTMCSLLASFAPSPITFIIFCSLLGLGTAMVSPPAIGLLFATYPEGQRRNRVTGALGVGNPMGFLLGSISSGLATKYSGWRASFYVLAAFFLLMTLMAAWTMPSIPTSGDRRKMFRGFDWGGTAFIVVGISFITASLTQGPELGWNSFRVVSLLLIGIFLLLSFIYWETIHPNPLLPLSVFRNKTFTLCILAVGFGYMSFITNLFWITLYMQNILHNSSLFIATKLLPQVLVGVVWSYLGQYLVSRISGRVIMGLGGMGYLLGAILVFFTDKETGYWALLFPCLLITVIGADFQFIVSNLYISKSMPDQSSLGAGILQTAMRLSISIGLSISSAAYNSVPASTAQSDPMKPYKRAYLSCIIFAALGLCFIPFMKMSRQGNHPEVLSQEEGSQNGKLKRRDTSLSTSSTLTTISALDGKDWALPWSLEEQTVFTSARRESVWMREQCRKFGKAYRSYNLFDGVKKGHKNTLSGSTVGNIEFQSVDLAVRVPEPTKRSRRTTWSG